MSNRKTSVAKINVGTKVLRASKFGQLFLIVLALIAGCSDKEEEKIYHTREFAKAHLLRQPDQVAAKLRQQIIMCLDSVGSADIEKPKICAAVVWGDPPKLMFWWIQDPPDVDGVVIRWPGNLKGQTLSVDQELLKEFFADHRERENSVLNVLAIEMQPYLNNGLTLPSADLEVCLVRKGQSVTNFIHCEAALTNEVPKESP